MRSMFNSAPFSRFDLGRHVLGQVRCPGGQMPMVENGQVTCVPIKSPSEMLMPPPTFGYGPAMGQMQDPYLTQAERDKLLADIRSAVAQTKAIDDLLVWSGENDPGLKKYFGMDATRFLALTNSIAPLYPTVRDLSERLAETDAEYWYRPSDQELAQVKQWVTGVNEMTKLVDRRRGQPYTAAPGTTPPPAPILQPAAGLAPAGGVSTQDILVGGAVAVGLGLLISAIL